jgi:hypothetical protein
MYNSYRKVDIAIKSYQNKASENNAVVSEKSNVNDIS